MVVSGYANGKDKFTWFTSPTPAVNSGLVTEETSYEPVKGILKIKATVKGHETNEYGVATILTRVKLSK